MTEGPAVPPVTEIRQPDTGMAAIMEAGAIHPAITVPAVMGIIK